LREAIWPPHFRRAAARGPRNDIARLAARPYPQIRFRSSEIVSAGEGDYLVNGELMIRGLDRREFGMRSESKLETGGFIVGDRVEVHVEAEAAEATRSSTVSLLLEQESHDTWPGS